MPVCPILCRLKNLRSSIDKNDSEKKSYHCKKNYLPMSFSIGRNYFQFYSQNYLHSQNTGLLPAMLASRDSDIRFVGDPRFF